MDLSRQVFTINILYEYCYTLYESDISIDLTKLKASVPLMCMYCTSTSTSKYSTHTLHGYQLLPLYHCCQILIVQYTRLGRHTIMPGLHNPFFGQQTLSKPLFCTNTSTSTSTISGDVTNPIIITKLNRTERQTKLLLVDMYTDVLELHFNPNINID